MDNPSIQTFDTLSYLMVLDRYMTVEQISAKSGIDITRFNKSGRLSNIERLKSSDIMKMQEFLKNNSFYFSIAGTEDPVKKKIKKKKRTEKTAKTIKSSDYYPRLGYDKFMLDKFKLLKKSLILLSSKERPEWTENESHIDFGAW